MTLSHEPFNDGVLSGCKFNVAASSNADGHDHRHYSEIRSIIEQSSLGIKTREIALDIFHIIATAEAKIHDKAVESVAFHEVGAWDSIADVICASYLIAAVGVRSTSVSALPLGGGQVKSAHGMLPIPAPATALILKDFTFVDDGIAGERITPTGAAILRHLKPASKSGGQLAGQGFGFGTKKFPGISNVLRILNFSDVSDGTGNDSASSSNTAAWEADLIDQLEFELDDQTAEEIATALGNLRKLPGVKDAIQYAVMGKKNRLGTSIRLLCECDATHMVLEHCFKLTTTLGIRQSTLVRSILNRREKVVKYADQSYRVKVASRPGGDTIKGEMDDFENTMSIAEQRKIRWQVESSDTEE